MPAVYLYGDKMADKMADKKEYPLIIVEVDCPTCGKYFTTKKEIPHVFKCDKCRKQLNALNYDEKITIKAFDRKDAIKRYEKSL